MKKLVLGSIMCLTIASAGFAAEGIEGTAQAASSYVVESNGTPRAVEASRLSTVTSGDTISAQEAPVTVRLADGSAVVVEKNSSITLDQKTVKLNSGKAVVGFAPKSKVTAQYKTLQVKNAKAAPATVALTSTTEGFSVQPMASTFSIVDTTTNTPVAETVGTDTMVSNQSGSWVATPVSTAVRANSTRTSEVARESVAGSTSTVESVSTSRGERGVLTRRPGVSSFARPVISEF